MEGPKRPPILGTQLGRDPRYGATSHSRVVAAPHALEACALYPNGEYSVSTNTTNMGHMHHLEDEYLVSLRMGGWSHHP